MMLALLGLSGAACDGCVEEPPVTNEPLLSITKSTSRLQADGVTYAEITVRGYNAEGLPDDSAVTVTVDGGTISSDVHDVSGDFRQLTGTPSNGSLSFEFRCEQLVTGVMTFTAENASTSTTGTLECVDVVGAIVVAFSQDEELPCSDLSADGQSYCVQNLSVNLSAPNLLVPQQNQSLNVAVLGATLTDPAEGEDAVVTQLSMLTPASAPDQQPQNELTVVTDAAGNTSFNVHSIALNKPMLVTLQITGTGVTGDPIDEQIEITIKPFEDASDLQVTATPDQIGSEQTSQISISVFDHTGAAPSEASGQDVRLQVPADSGATLSLGTQTSDAQGVLIVTLTANNTLVTFTAPEVTARTNVNVSATYQADPTVPSVSETVAITVHPENSVIVNAAASPTTFFSDVNETSTITATIEEFVTGAVGPLSDATVRFSVKELYRGRAILGPRAATDDPVVGDTAFPDSVEEVSNEVGIATAIVSSRNERARGIVEVDVEVIRDNAVVGSDTVQIEIKREPILQSIVFVSAEPAVIGVRGGAYPSSSTITFQVFDDLSQPLPNVSMQFDVNATADPEAFVVSNGTTGPDGMVTTTLAAGTQAGPISIVATALYGGRRLTSESIPVAVTGGLPSFANSYLQCSPVEQAQLSPATISCTVVLSDRFTNRAPAGLPVQFRAEGGNIDPVSLTSVDGSAAATFGEGTPGGSSASLLSSKGDSWSYGAVVPGPGSLSTDEATGWTAAADAACFDRNAGTSCSVFDLCREAEHATVADLSTNLVYCPLLVDPADDVGCWNKLEAGAVTRDADHLSQGLLDRLGIDRATAQALLTNSMTPQVYFQGTDATSDHVRAIVQAHLDNMFRCGAVTACITGQNLGVPFVEGDECLVAPGCMDFHPGTECPQDGLRTITAIVRGEESFTDLNGNGILDYTDTDGNGRHTQGEPITENAGGDPVAFHDVVHDMPEPFLDKDDNCFADDFTGSLRLSTYNAIRRTDIYNDEDGSGSYGYALADPVTGVAYPEPLLTNQQWDRDKEIFFSDHVLIVEGQARLKAGAPCSAVGQVLSCPYDPASSYVCEAAGDGGMLTGCYPRTTDPTPISNGETVELLYRWVDDNGNCFSPGFDNFAWVYDDSYYFGLFEGFTQTVFTSSHLSRDYCGFGREQTPLREWCDAVPELGRPEAFTMAYTTQCYTFEDDVVTRQLTFVNTDANTFDPTSADGNASASLSFAVDCTPVP